MVANRTLLTFQTLTTQVQIQADLKTSGMMFSHQLNQLSEQLEEVENEGGEMSEVEFDAELDAEVSNWTSFPTTSLAASTQTLGIFVPRSSTPTTLSLLQPNNLWTYSPTLAQVWFLLLTLSLLLF